MFTTITDLYPLIGFNTPWSLVLLYMGGALGVNTWLIKGFFDTVPKELDESAKVDGASHTTTFFSDHPAARHADPRGRGRARVHRGDQRVPDGQRVPHPERDARPSPSGLFGLIAGERNANFGMFAAGTLLTAIPTVVLFFSLQKYIVGGLTSGAVKG